MSKSLSVEPLAEDGNPAGREKVWVLVSPAAQPVRRR